jgi:uncharacterized membrane protein
VTDPARTANHQAPLLQPERVAAGLLGGVLIGAAPRDREHGRLLRVIGLALIAIGSEPLLVDAIRALEIRRRQLSSRSSIEIERNIGVVFAFLKDFENLPRVIGNIHSIVDYQDGRSHWQAYSPSGRLVEFDAVVTKYVPRTVIAWESIPGSSIEMRGMARFTAITPTRTRVELEMEYSPQSFGLKDVLHTLVGPNQQDRLEQDLAHTRYYLEKIAPRSAEFDPFGSGR